MQLVLVYRYDSQVWEVIFLEIHLFPANFRGIWGVFLRSFNGNPLIYLFQINLWGHTSDKKSENLEYFSWNRQDKSKVA